MPLLRRNRALLAQDGVEVQVARLEWGSDADHKALDGGLLGADVGFDVILASDVVLQGFAVDRLLESVAALLARHPEALVLLGYEDREDWETIGTFLYGAEQTGLEYLHEHLGDEGEDGDLLLYTFRWRETVADTKLAERSVPTAAG